MRQRNPQYKCYGTRRKVLAPGRYPAQAMGMGQWRGNLVGEQLWNSYNNDLCLQFHWRTLVTSRRLWEAPGKKHADSVGTGEVSWHSPYLPTAPRQEAGFRTKRRWAVTSNWCNGDLCFVLLRFGWLEAGNSMQDPAFHSAVLCSRKAPTWSVFLTFGDAR